MKGYHVSRRFGWDTHGVPVEYEIDKKLKISGRDAVMQMGKSYMPPPQRFRPAMRHGIESGARFGFYPSDSYRTRIRRFCAEILAARLDYLLY